MKGNINPEYALNVRKIIGKYFCDVRKSKGLTQKELAEKMGVSQQTVQKIETGSWNFSMYFLFLFCHHLDLYLFLPEKESNDPMADWMRNRYSQIDSKN